MFDLYFVKLGMPLEYKFIHPKLIFHFSECLKKPVKVLSNHCNDGKSLVYLL